jgi:L-ascorbate metabolism protein UlaG (beta-lactamase superfamily)
MAVRITYVHHNCFILEIGGRTLLFDYPSEEHRTDAARALVEQKVAGADLWVVVSHSHPDHCTPEVAAFAGSAARCTFIVSYDVPDMYPEFEYDAGLDVTVLDPDEPAVVQGVPVQAFESTDLGVGFLFSFPGCGVYFGGDVAAWVWDRLDSRSRAAGQAYFNATLAELARKGVDIAFSNTDKRLENWAGGLEFVRTVRPRVFVPMHVFGKTQWVREFADLLHEKGGMPETLFVYQRTGDSLDVACG